MTSKVEFFVEMTCESCVKVIRKSLEHQNGIKNLDIQLNNGTVIVESTLSIDGVKTLLESTGRKVVLKGFASSLAAVAMIESESLHVQGVIRFMQNDDKSDICIIDGTVDGLNNLPHSLGICEFGDISNGCKSVGSLYEPKSTDGKKLDSILGTFEPAENGRTSFRLTKELNLCDVIGRSAVLVRGTQDKIACGIIARSAGLFQNPKTICACDGISIWDERNPLKATL